MFFIKTSWPCFSEPQLCRNQIYTIAIVKFSNRSIQNLFSVDKGICMELVLSKIHWYWFFPMNFVKILKVTFFIKLHTHFRV